MVVVAGRLERVYRSEVGNYLDDWFWSCFEIWAKYRRFGFPFSGGYAEQHAHLIELIEAAELAFDRYAARQRK